LIAILAPDRARIVLGPWSVEPGRFLDRFWFVSDVPGFRAGGDRPGSGRIPSPRRLHPWAFSAPRLRMYRDEIID